MMIGWFNRALIGAFFLGFSFYIFGNEAGNPNLNYGPYPPAYMKYYNYLYSTNSLYYWRYIDSSLSIPNMPYTNSQLSNMPWLKFYSRGMNNFNINNQPAFSPIIYNIQNPSANHNHIKKDSNGDPFRSKKSKEKFFSANPHFDELSITPENNNELQYHNSDTYFMGSGRDDFNPSNFGNEF